MPLIRITSLPQTTAFPIDDVLEQLCLDFATTTGIALAHVSATWRLLEPGHYAVGGRVARGQPDDSHPLLVDLLVPDFNKPAMIESMLETIAFSLSRHAGVRRDNIFIHCALATSGCVFDQGDVVTWESVKSAAKKALAMVGPEDAAVSGAASGTPS